MLKTLFVVMALVTIAGATAQVMDFSARDVKSEFAGSEMIIGLDEEYYPIESSVKVVDGMRTTYVMDKYDLIVYPKVYNGMDALEMELVLKERPSLDIFYFTIMSELDYHYQPPLDEEMGLGILHGCNATVCQDSYRPIDIVGSYAVYDGPYKKFHVYRPLVWDAKGNEVWGTLYINRGILSVSIDKIWLDKAVYPVTIDPTIGKTDIGGSLFSVESKIIGSHFTITEGDATVINFSAYLSDVGGTP